MDYNFDLDKARQAMILAIVKTFSDMAFIETVEDPDPAGKDETPMEQNILIIDILKPISGSVMLYLPDNLKDKIILNVFAKDSSEVKENEKDDCLLEILNVLSGNFLNSYYGKVVGYKIELPQLQVGQENHPQEPFFLIHMNAEGILFKVAMNSVRYRYP